MKRKKTNAAPPPLCSFPPLHCVLLLAQDLMPSSSLEQGAAGAAAVGPSAMSVPGGGVDGGGGCSVDAVCMVEVVEHLDPEPLR